MKVFMVIITILLFSIAVAIPKKASQLEIYTSNLFILLMVCIVDLIFIITYKLYGYMSEGIQWFAVIVLFIIYPSVNTITLKYYAYTDSLKDKAIYTVSVTAVYTACEWVFLKVGFLYYSGWKLYYSAIAYLFIVMLIEFHLHIIDKLARNLVKNNTSSSN